MPSLTAAELLAMWERGCQTASSERPLALLAPACPESGPGELAALPIGERDGRLLRLREATFGSHIAAACDCPACGQRLELTLTVADLQPAATPAPPAEETTLSVDGYVVRFRLPGTPDLAAIAAESDLAAARQALLGRCLLAARREGGQAASPDCLPEPVVAAVVARMAELDPQANLELAVTCPSCRNQWAAAFDIASFFWTELDAWAQRLLREVHALAAAYGWREADIIALGPLRRKRYLEFIGP
jgi:hypothetical protein